MSEPLVQTVRQQIAAQGPGALLAHRLQGRHARLVEPEILSPDQAELHDLNRIVWAAVEKVLPLCDALGVRLVLQQDPRLPAVPMLVRCVEDTLDAVLDLCLDGSAHRVRVTTRAQPRRVLTTIERWCPALAADGDGWMDVGMMGQLELIVGDCTARAMGGQLRVLRRADDLRVSLALPSGAQLQHARTATERPPVRARRRRRELCFPVHGIGRKAAPPHRV